MANKVPTNWRVCATCSCWCGRASSDCFHSWVDYDGDERAMCAGGGFSGCLGHEFLLAMGAAIQEMMTGMNAIHVHGLGSGAASGIPDGAIHGRSVFDVCRYGLL